MRRRRLLIIGWDAADWQMLDPLLQSGEMPALSAFLKNGVRGNIATLSPTLSPMLWTSIATGKRAYDHGICGFVESLPLEDKVIPVRSTARKVRAIWNILNQAGLKTNVVNWWPSFPAEIVDGVSVSNHFHLPPPAFGHEWPFDPATVYPMEVGEILSEFRVHPAELGLAHILPFIPDAASLDPEKDPVVKSCLRILAHAASIHNAATWLMEHREWDFMAVYQEAIDHFSHLAMRYHPPRIPAVSEQDFERYRHIMNACYRFHDMMLERLMQLAGPDCDIILLSDHGFASGEGRIENLPDIPAAPALEHRRFGVFAATGPSFRSGQIYGASLLDITPTLLHYFDLPVAEDMEGKVLQSLFRDQKAASRIPTWENLGEDPRFMDDHTITSNEVLERLSDLKYVELPEQNKSEYVRRELLYNRCLSLLEGNRYEQALAELEPEWTRNRELRFGLLLSQACQGLGRTGLWHQLIHDMENVYPGNGAVLFEKGMKCLSENAVDEAMLIFNDLENAGVRSAQLSNEIARTLLVMGRYTRAREYFDKALMLDPDNTAALTGKAQCLIEEARSDEALVLLEKSLDLLFYQPRAHYLMGVICHQHGDTALAEKALRICLEQAPKHVQAQRLHAEILGKTEQEVSDPVIIVSGWPRSGTSMMMRMLKEAGLGVLADETRAADPHNPEGYYEHPAVLKTGEDQSWVVKARNKAVKVVLPLLRYLPPTENYRVVVMRRPLSEVIVSQEVMKGQKKDEVMRNFPFQSALNLQKEEERVFRWLSNQPQFKIMEVQMEDCIARPEEIMQELAEFLHQPLDVSRAAAVPSEESRRIKLGE